MNLRFHRLQPALVAIVVTLGGPVATSHAQVAPPDAPAEASAPAAPLAESLTGMARADYAAARILYEDGDYQGALQKLQGAYDASRDPRLLWNMAACEKNLRRYAEVMRLIDRYLAEGGSLVGPEDRAAALELLETMRGFVTELVVNVSEPEAAIHVDDVQIATSPMQAPVRVDMGQRRIRVTKPGFQEFTFTQALPGGSALQITANLVADRHEGRLRILAKTGDVIRVDGKVVGTGVWEGTLPSGTHAVEVSHEGMRTHATEVVVKDNDTNTLHVALQEEQKPIVMERGGIPAWAWIAGGALVVGAGVGAYFLMRPGDEQFQSPSSGSWGVIEL
jgi:hypothetical protein